MKEINSLFINFISVLYIICNVHGNSEDAATVSQLFPGSSNSDRCTMNGQGKGCENEKLQGDKTDKNGRKVIGPKFQKVHLELPRINPVRVSVNNRYLILHNFP